MESDLTNRIKKIAQEYGLTSTAFADRVEIPRPVMSHIFSGRNRPSLEVMQKVGLAFPEVDLEWLVYGKGQMLKKVAKATAPEEKKNDEQINVSKYVPGDNRTEISLVPEAGRLPEPVSASKVLTQRKVRKIVYFYEDNSFEEFWPLGNE